MDESGIKGRIDKRLLIHTGERGNVLYFLLFFMLVSAGMAIGRSSADALFLKRLGFEYLPVMYMIQSLLLAAVSMVYTAFADRIPAERFFRNLLSVLIILILASWFVIHTSGNPFIYPVYYLIYEVSSEILLVHAALYMNQNMTTLQAKRLAPLVYAGAQTGTIIGGLALVMAAPVIGTQNMLLVWCGLLVAGSTALYIRHRRHGASTHFRTPRKSQRLLNDCLLQIKQGLRYTYSSSLLRASSLTLFFMVIAFYILCYSVNRVYTQTFESEESLTRFFGLLTAVTSMLALTAQLFITNRAIRRFGVRTINLLFPWTTLASMAALTASFTLPAALAASLNKDALMPAFRNPVHSMFFNVLPDYMQGRVRAISVAVVLPLALLTCGLLLVIMQHLGNPAYFLVPGMIAALLHLYFSWKMNNAYVNTLIATLKERLLLPNKQMYGELNGCSEEDMKEIMRGVAHPDTEVSIAFSRVLAESFPDKAAGPILERMETENSTATDRYLKLIVPLDIIPHSTALYRLAKSGDAHLQADLLQLLLEQGDQGSILRAIKLLSSSNPRLRATAIHAALRYPDAGPGADHLVTAWYELLQDRRCAQLAALDLIPELEHMPAKAKQLLESAYQRAFSELLDDTPVDIKIRTLQGMRAWSGDSSIAIQRVLLQSLTSEHPGLRQAAAECLHLVAAEQRSELLLQAIGDADPRVRQAGIDTLSATTVPHTNLVLEWITGNRGSPRAQQALLTSLLDSGMPRSVFETIARIKSEQAVLLGEALSVVDAGAADDQRHQLLRITLKEQLDQTIDLALLALEPLYECGLIHIIRAGFASGDARHIANACEALENLDSKDITAGLSSMLQQSINNDFGSHDGHFRSLDDVLRWCSGQRNEWLRICAGRLLSPQQT
jgi:HEAT repeat protein